MPHALPFEPETVARAKGPVVHVALGGDGRPVSARAAVRVDATPERVWSTVTDSSAYSKRVPMIDRSRVNGDLVEIDLRFRISLFSVGFAFQAKTEREDGRWIEIAHTRGEPRDLRIRFDLASLPDSSSTLLVSSIGFDIFSLGWLVKVFLKHHPEIRYGVYPGCALALLDAMKSAAEA